MSFDKFRRAAAAEKQMNREDSSYLPEDLDAFLARVKQTRWKMLGLSDRQGLDVCRLIETVDLLRMNEVARESKTQPADETWSTYHA